MLQIHKPASVKEPWNFALTAVLKLEGKEKAEKSETE